MELLEQLKDVFLLSKLKINRQTRKTLDKWLQETKFEKRMRVYYEHCGEGKSSDSMESILTY